MTQWQEGETHRSQNRDSCPSTNCTQTDRGGGHGDSYELWEVKGPPGRWAWVFLGRLRDLGPSAVASGGLIQLKQRLRKKRVSQEFTVSSLREVYRKERIL